LIVVDTSVLISLFRGRPTPGVALLRELELADEPFALPVVCCQEVLQGARDEREWQVLSEYLSSQRLLAPQDPWRTHRDAARIFFDCRRRGVTVRSAVDCLIAQLVIDNAGILLHEDVDFEHIREVRPLRTLFGGR
jgi:predicted nucleic acid-binding protein